MKKTTVNLADLQAGDVEDITDLDHYHPADSRNANRGGGRGGLRGRDDRGGYGDRRGGGMYGDGPDTTADNWRSSGPRRPADSFGGGDRGDRGDRGGPRNDIGVWERKAPPSSDSLGNRPQGPFKLDVGALKSALSEVNAQLGKSPSSTTSATGFTSSKTNPFGQALPVTAGLATPQENTVPVSDMNTVSSTSSVKAAAPLQRSIGADRSDTYIPRQSNKTTSGGMGRGSDFRNTSNVVTTKEHSRSIMDMDDVRRTSEDDRRDRRDGGMPRQGGGMPPRQQGGPSGGPSGGLQSAGSMGFNRNLDSSLGSRRPGPGGGPFRTSTTDFGGSGGASVAPRAVYGRVFDAPPSSTVAMTSSVAVKSSVTLSVAADAAETSKKEKKKKKANVMKPSHHHQMGRNLEESVDPSIRENWFRGCAKDFVYMVEEMKRIIEERLKEDEDTAGLLEIDEAKVQLKSMEKNFVQESPEVWKSTAPAMALLQNVILVLFEHSKSMAPLPESSMEKERLLESNFIPWCHHVMSRVSIYLVCLKELSGLEHYGRILMNDICLLLSASGLPRLTPSTALSEVFISAILDTCPDVISEQLFLAWSEDIDDESPYRTNVMVQLVQLVKSLSIAMVDVGPPSDAEDEL